VIALNRLLICSVGLFFSGLMSADAQEIEDNSGYSWSLEYKGDLVGNATGGLKRGQVFLGNIDAIAQFNGARLWNLDGSTVFLYGLGNHGGKPSSLVGDAQGLDNIEANQTFRLYEAWIEQVFSGSRFSVLAGLYDINSEFDSKETSGLFINSSHGIGPDFSQSGENGPSIFPVTSLGLRLKWSPNPSVYIQTVILDGVPGNPERPNGTWIQWGKNDGLLSITELGFVHGNDAPSLSRTNSSLHDMRTAVGFWAYTSQSETLLPGSSYSNWGVYGMVEKNVLAEPGVEGQGLGLFARFGLAEPSINRFGLYISSGLVYTGLIHGRDEDQVGLAIAIAKNTDDYREASKLGGMKTTSAEHNVEFSYLAALSSHASVQFDLQYYHHPDTNPDLDSALVGVMRWVISF
jgi:porin